MPEAYEVRVTVGIATRNRPEALRACLASLAALGDALAEVIVVDDESDVPLDAALEAAPPRTRVIRLEHNKGYIAGRNAVVRQASTDVVLLMDDDAALIDDGRILDALRLFASRPQIGSVACAMADRNGARYPSHLQPAPVEYACYVAAYIGFAHLVRRSAFLAVGGYRESFFYYGEEKDLCIRLLHAGYEGIYLPQVRVVHAFDPAGRSASRYVRYAVRNDCLFALYNEPWPMLLVSLPVRLMRYFSMSRGLHDPGGFRWVVAEVLRTFRHVVATRTPVSWATIARWRRLSRTWPAFA